MKKIKVLRVFVITLLLSIITRAGFYTFYSLNYQFMDITDVLLNISILMFIGLIFIERGLFYSIKKGYFNSKSAVKFKKGGLFILLSGGFGIIRSILLLLSFDNASDIQAIVFQNISQSIIIAIIGFVLIIISDYINKGNFIQQENDLTI